MRLTRHFSISVVAVVGTIATLITVGLHIESVLFLTLAIWLGAASIVVASLFALRGYKRLAARQGRHNEDLAEVGVHQERRYKELNYQLEQLDARLQIMQRRLIGSSENARYFSVQTSAQMSDVARKLERLQADIRTIGPTEKGPE